MKKQAKKEIVVSTIALGLLTTGAFAPLNLNKVFADTTASSAATTTTSSAASSATSSAVSSAASSTATSSAASGATSSAASSGASSTATSSATSGATSSVASSVASSSAATPVAFVAAVPASTAATTKSSAASTTSSSAAPLTDTDITNYVNNFDLTNLQGTWADAAGDTIVVSGSTMTVTTKAGVTYTINANSAISGSDSYNFAPSQWSNNGNYGDRAYVTLPAGQDPYAATTAFKYLDISVLAPGASWTSSNSGDSTKDRIMVNLFEVDTSGTWSNDTSGINGTIYYPAAPTAPTKPAGETVSKKGNTVTATGTGANAGITLTAQNLVIPVGSNWSSFESYVVGYDHGALITFGQLKVVSDDVNPNVAGVYHITFCYGDPVQVTVTVTVYGKKQASKVDTTSLTTMANSQVAMPLAANVSGSTSNTQTLPTTGDNTASEAFFTGTGTLTLTAFVVFEVLRHRK